MKRNEDFRQALGQPDDDFRNTVMDTLNELNREDRVPARSQRKLSLRLACAFAALVLLCAGTVLARYGISGFPDGLPDSRTDPSVPVETAFIPLAASGSAAAVPGSILADCEQVTLTLKKAVTDGLGVYLTVEAKPKHEHSLVLDLWLDPYMDSPDVIGKTPDYISQTIMQWAKEHDYQEVLCLSLFSPADDPHLTLTSDANIQSVGSHHAVTLQEDGSSLLRLAGGALPGTDTYDLYWRVVPWDMEKENTYRDIPNGREVTLALVYEKGEHGWAKATVSPTGETPELIGEYTLLYPAQDYLYDMRNFISVNFYRTSLSDYCEVRSTDVILQDLTAVALCRGNAKQSPLFGYSENGIRYHHMEEDGSSVTRLALSIRRKFPDELWLAMAAPENDQRDSSDLTFRIINKNAVPADNDKIVEVQPGSGGVRAIPAAIATADGDYPTAFTISKGAAEGLEAGQAVENNSALLGVITEVREHEATVSTVFNPDSIIDGIIPNDCQTQGPVRGGAGESASPGKAPLCRMVYFPDDAPVSPGDTVVTSGSAILPKGIPIGTVTEIVTDPESGKPYAYVEPAADFRNLQTVTVFLLNPEPLSSDPD